ncbi:IS3 family transposase, partial [Enterococcus casseliflavus]|nr:IS3 family transposase [Enterococcus casseliflavus]
LDELKTKIDQYIYYYNHKRIKKKLNSDSFQDKVPQGQGYKGGLAAALTASLLESAYFLCPVF